MLANYGYADGSGTYYITIDTDKCDGCAACVPACPRGLLEVQPDDYDEMKAVVKGSLRKDIKYQCGPCKPVSNRPPLPCQVACTPGAIAHSW